jgi:hypothetical protein
MKTEELITAIIEKTGLTKKDAEKALSAAKANPTGLVYLGWKETNPYADPRFACNGGGYSQPCHRWLTTDCDVIEVLNEDRGDFGWEEWLILPDGTHYWVGVDQEGNSTGWWDGFHEGDEVPGWWKTQQQAEEGAAKAAFREWIPILEEVAGEAIFWNVVRRWAEE